jgi:transposase-like protein
MEAPELKRRLAARGRGKRGCPAELKEAVLAYAARRKAEGVSRRATANELGMSEQTLWYWASQVRRRARLAPVQVVHDRAPELVVEFGPLRVRGLDVTSVAELLRRLG